MTTAAPEASQARPEAAIGPAMICPCTNRLWTRASIRPARNSERKFTPIESARSPATLRKTMRRVRVRETLGDEELPGALQPAGDARTTTRLHCGGSLAEGVALSFRIALRRGAGPHLGPCDFCGSIEHVVCRVLNMPSSSGHGRH